MGLVLTFLTSVADLLVTNHSTAQSLNPVRHSVGWWVTNNFYYTPNPILTVEACFPPMDVSFRQRGWLSALRIACAPPTHAPSAGRFPASIFYLSNFRALDPASHLTKGSSFFYLPLDWRTPVPSPPLTKPLSIDTSRTSQSH